MKKKVFLYLFVTLSLLGLVFAAHSTTIVSSTPGSSYETVKTTFEIWLRNNLNSTHSINSITVNAAGYLINEIISPVSGWSSLVNGNILTFYTTTDPISPGFIGVLIFNATANLVNSSTFNTWNISSVDTNNETFGNSISVTALNDSIAPQLLNPSPANGGIVKNESQIFSVDVTELETGILDGNLEWDFYTIYGAWSTANFTQSMTCTTNSCSTTIDLFNPDQIYLSYKVTVRDNALNQNSLMRFIAIDQYAPIVNIQLNNITVNQDLPLTYAVDDNSFSFDPQLNASLQCELYVDSSSNNITTITSSGNQTVNINVSGLSDGLHSWYVSCTDKAGYSTASTTGAFTLDTTGPEINLSSPANGSVISNTSTIDFYINDLYSGVSSAWYDNGIDILLNTSYDTISGWSEGLNTITVYANDSLNNLAGSVFSFIIDSSAPVIDLSGSLPNESYSGNPVTIPFAVSDAYSQNLTCTLNIDSATYQILTNGNGNYAFQNLNYLQNGTYEWNITCIDQGNNSATSTNRMLNIDATAPNISLVSPLDETVLTNGNVDFIYTVYDNAAIANCSLYLNDIANNTVTSGVVNDGLTNNTISTVLAEGSYTWFISCYDIYNNQGNSSQFSSPWSIFFDITPPVISNVGSSTTSDTATISWDVNEATSEIIYYWIDQNSTTQITLGLNASLSKSYVITSLSPSTTYYYNLTAADQFGNSANTSILNFTTLSPSISPTGGGGGGGGGSEAPCVPNWTVEEWSKCSVNGLQTRSVEDKNGCQTELDKPITIQGCTYIECSSDSDCVSGYICKDNKCEKPMINETAEQPSIPPTGFAVLNFIKGNIKYAGLTVLAGLIIYGCIEYLKRRNRVNVNKVREVIKEGRIRKD